MAHTLKGAPGKRDVLVIMGSQSDEPVAKTVRTIFDTCEVTYEFHVASAHRKPREVERLVEQAPINGFSMIVAIAGKAAALPGFVASFSGTLPVYGIPVESSTERDTEAALLSMLCLPAGTPVAVFAPGKTGALNAALHVAQVLSARDPTVAKAVREYRTQHSAALSSVPTFTS